MPVDVIDAITKMLHEIAPWAAVAVAGISAWQANRAREHIKAAVINTKEIAAKTTEAVVRAKEIATQIADNTAKTEEVAAKVDEVHTCLDRARQEAVSIAQDATEQRRKMEEGRK